MLCFNFVPQGASMICSCHHETPIRSSVRLLSELDYGVNTLRAAPRVQAAVEFHPRTAASKT